MKFEKNTQAIVKKAYGRMQLVTKTSSFSVSIEELKTIYISYIRSKLEYCASVFYSSLTEQQNNKPGG